MTPLELLICVFLIGTSAFLSGTEIALFSLSRFQLRSFKERFKKAHRRIKRLLSDPGGLLITILFCNEVVNISTSAIITEAVSRRWTDPQYDLFGIVMPNWVVQMIIGTLLTTPIILFFGEVTPKTIAARANQIIALFVINPITWIYKVVMPIRFILNKFINFIAPAPVVSGTDAQSKGRPLLLEEEFLSMVEEGHKEGTIQESELELIKNVFELDDASVASIYTPIQQVQSIPSTTTLKEALHALRGKTFSRLPVTGKSRKQVVGILYSKDLLPNRLNPEFAKTTVASIMRKPVVVAPTMQLNSLFRKLKQHKTHMAVVEQKPGECMGVVTMADVLEALFEDIFEAEEKTAR